MDADKPLVVLFNILKKTLNKAMVKALNAYIKDDCRFSWLVSVLRFLFFLIGDDIRSVNIKFKVIFSVGA